MAAAQEAAWKNEPAATAMPKNKGNVQFPGTTDWSAAISGSSSFFWLADIFEWTAQST